MSFEIQKYIFINSCPRKHTFVTNRAFFQGKPRITYNVTDELIYTPECTYLRINKENYSIFIFSYEVVFSYTWIRQLVKYQTSGICPNQVICRMYARAMSRLLVTETKM